MNRLILILLAALLGAAPPAGPNVHGLTEIAVVDGDTLDATIHLALGIKVRERIRCSDFDAWERSHVRQTVKVSEAEIERGRLAKNALDHRLRECDAWVVIEDKRDAYGRVLGKVIIRPRDGDKSEWLAEWMTKEGHVRK